LFFGCPQVIKKYKGLSQLLLGGNDYHCWMNSLAAQLVLPQLCHFHCLGDAYCSQLISQEGFGNIPVTKSVTHPEVD
jgi:hypothetical protein